MPDRAILFGINNYESISDLRGCINDVQNMQSLLRETFGFRQENIQTYYDQQVTKDAIRDGFEWLADGAAPGDRLVLHFSGHGSYKRSEDGDEEKDELLCLYGMDWNDDSSYLLDDELGELLRQLPADVDITVVLDCCHSGTGTKAITPAGQVTRSITPKTRLVIEADESSLAGTRGAMAPPAGEPVSIARFVEPPEHLRVSESAPIRTSILQATRSGQLNHLLLAGAQDVQTAADAFIAGDFHGAFTYYLAENARAVQSSRSAKEVYRATADALQQGGYSQIPQIEGIRQEEPLFGDGAATPGESPGQQPGSPLDNAPPPPAPFKAAGPGADVGAQTELLERFLTVSEKFIDLTARLLDVAEAGGARTLARRGANEVYVAVHGISRHVQGYSEDWFQALAPHLRQPLDREEVVWSHHVNARSLDRSEAAEMEAVQEALAHTLEQRSAELVMNARNRSVDGAVPDEASASRAARGLAFDDFVRYMVQEQTREAILKEFIDVVQPLLEAGRTLHIVAHSWGSVVAYEGLRRLDDIQGGGIVDTLFTVGAAISMAPVQANLFDRTQDGRLPDRVSRIINLDARGDIVGGRVADQFEGARDFLRLSPTGCRTIPFTGTTLNFACAHSSYFEPANKAVNRDLFARFINGS